MRKTSPPLFVHERWARSGIVLCVLVMLGLLAFMNFRMHLPFFPKISCGFLGMTGLPCPLCGGTRAMRAILHGDLQRALYYNPLALPALFILVVFLGILLAEAVKGRKMVDWNRIEGMAKKFLPVFLIVILLWWIPHIVLALKTPKPQLVNLKNPIAAKLRSLMQ